MGESRSIQKKVWYVVEEHLDLIKIPRKRRRPYFSDVGVVKTKEGLTTESTTGRRCDIKRCSLLVLAAREDERLMFQSG